MERKEISLEDSKKIMLEILKSVDCCCRQNDLKYSLDFGTLLGAVRHKGFIPWDDDIDLMMPRRYFNQFLKLYNDDHYDMITNDDSNWGWHYVRVCDKNSIVVFAPNSERVSEHGIWLSIFPVDGVPDSSEEWIAQQQRINFYYNLCRLKRSSWTKGGNIIKNIAKIISRWILFPISLRYLAKREEFWMCKHSFKKTEKVFTKVINYYVRPSCYFDKVIDLDFEGNKFMAIADHHQYLTSVYNDYMTPPPASERVPKHGFTAYWKK